MTLLLFVFVIVLLITAASYFMSTKNKALMTQLITVMILSFIASTCILTYHNPYHDSAHLLISLHGAEYVWGETVKFSPHVVAKPGDLAVLKNIVKNSEKVRIIGSGHSFSPLIVTNDTLIDISELNGVISFENNVVTALAGTTVEEVQIFLTQRNRTLHGFGSIHSQTLAGAFSTSLVGTQPTSFASHVTKAWTIDASGVEHEWTGDDLYYLRNSMGLLGVITSMELTTFPNEYTTHEVQKLALEELIAMYASSDAAALDAATSMSQIHENILTVINTGTGEIKPTEYPRLYQINDFVLYDVVLMPIFSFFKPQLEIMYYSAINPRDVETALLGRDMKQFGMTYTDYIIPIQTCTEAIKEMAKLDVMADPLIRIKYLSEGNTSCLDVTQVPSCRVEVYTPQNTPDVYEYVGELQRIAVEHGGFVHWGKLFVGNVTTQLERFACYPEFKARQNAADPTGKFVNDYLAGVPAEYTEYNGRTWLFHGQLLLTLILVLVFMCSHQG